MELSKERYFKCSQRTVTEEKLGKKENSMQNYKSPICHVKSQGEINLYIKREDLLPFSFGGNKLRIAKEYFSDMQKQGKNCIMRDPICVESLQIWLL